MGLDWSQGFLEPPTDIGGIAHKVTLSIYSLIKLQQLCIKLIKFYNLI